MFRQVFRGATATRRVVVANAFGRRAYASGGAEDVRRVGIVGCPFDKGQKINSVIHEGPKSIRDGGLVAHIREFNEWTDIHDYGDIQLGTAAPNTTAPSSPPNMRNYHEVMSTMSNLAERVCQVLHDGRLCITLGGDHSLGLGSVDGHLRYNPDAVLFWVDAHADLNTNATSGSGSMHGMPVALAAKELQDHWPDEVRQQMGDGWQPKLSLKDVVYIGLRSVDPLERLIADQNGMQLYGMEEIDRAGIVAVMDKALARVDPEGKRGIHISFDIDALDALEAPSTGTAVRGGLTLREGLYIVERLSGTGRLEAIDLAEVNPAIGTPADVQKTVSAAIALLSAACGTRRSGNVPRGTTVVPKECRAA